MFFIFDSRGFETLPVPLSMPVVKSNLFALQIRNLRFLSPTVTNGNRRPLSLCPILFWGIASIILFFCLGKAKLRSAGDALLLPSVIFCQPTDFITYGNPKGTWAYSKPYLCPSPAVPEGDGQRICRANRVALLYGFAKQILQEPTGSLYYKNQR